VTSRGAAALDRVKAALVELEMNPSAFPILSLWPRVTVRMTPWQSIMIELGDKTTGDDLRKIIPEARAWRNRLKLTRRREPDAPRYSAEGIRLRLLARNRAGVGPTKLAREVNEHFRLLLVESVGGDERACAYLNEMAEALLGKNAGTEVEQARVQHQLGESAWNHCDLPVTPDQMRDLIKSWRRGGQK
jgi:hypothetical protein